MAAPKLDLVLGPALVVADDVVYHLVGPRKALAGEPADGVAQVLTLPLPTLKQAILQNMVKCTIPYRVNLGLAHQTAPRSWPD